MQEEAFGYIADFQLAIVHPNAFDFHSMPSRWQQAQQVLAAVRDQEDGLMRRLQTLYITQGKEI